MTKHDLARLMTESIAQHQTRGLVDAATGMEDVVIHGRVNMLAAAEEVLAAVLDRQMGGHSWATWFAHRAAARRDMVRVEVLRAGLVAQLEEGLADGEAALVRMRLRTLAMK